MPSFLKYGFSMTPTGRFTMVLVDGPLAECVRININNQYITIQPSKKGIHGSKYNINSLPKSWSYQVTNVGLGEEAWEKLLAKYPGGVSMMELDEPMKRADGSLRFHLPNPEKVKPSYPRPGGTRTNLGFNGLVRGSNLQTEPPSQDQAGLKFFLPSEKTAMRDVNLDLPTAVSFINEVKRGFGDSFSMTFLEDGQLEVTIMEVFR